MNEQLEMLALLPVEEIDNAVIDAALHHVENQSVLRGLLAGKLWGDAFGMGGGSSPVHWMADSKGIEVNFATDQARLIKPARILQRAKEYREIKPPKDPNREPF